jgi:DNA-binding NtrC family response regulator
MTGKGPPSERERTRPRDATSDPRLTAGTIETSTEPEAPSVGVGPWGDHRAVLVVVAAPGDPSRLGQSLWPAPGESGVFGRGGSRSGDPHPRLLLVRHRPGIFEPTEPFAMAAVSRAQLLVRSAGEAVSVENVGQARLLHNGVEARAARVVPGDVLEIGQQLAFLCVMRAPGQRAELPLHPFGERDADGMVGESEAIWALRRAIAFVASRREHVLLRGPSGSGKELVAHAIHRQDGRSEKPLVARNAATLPEGIVDAELFGNAKGYPNPGMPDRPGLIGAAHGSTLFLDEFAELPQNVQAHLLRVLDAGEYQRLGEAATRRSDFRLIAATNRPLSSLKEDIAARLVLRLEISGLDARREDIPLLLLHMARGIAAEDPGALQGGTETSLGKLIEPSWARELVTRGYSTHARELRGLLWERIARASGSLAVPVASTTPRSPARRTEGQAQGTSMPAEGEDDAVAIDAQTIRAALVEHNGNLERVWRALGLSNRYVLRRLIKNLGIEVTRFPPR